MDVFHLADCGKLKFVYHTIDTYLGFEQTTALSFEKSDSIITHLFKVMAFMEIPVKIKTDYALGYVSSKMQFFSCQSIRRITDMPHNPTIQVVIEKSYHTLKDTLKKQKGLITSPKDRLHSAS